MTAPAPLPTEDTPAAAGAEDRHYWDDVYADEPNAESEAA